MIERLPIIRIQPIPILRLLISLALALMLWGWVTTQRDPETSRTVTDIALPMPSLPENLMVVGDLDVATIRVEGPSSLIEEFNEQDLDVRLAGAEIAAPGSYTLDVEVDAPDAINVVGVTPSRVNLLVDVRETASFHVDPLLPNLEGDNRRIGTVTITPSEVTVTGPSEYVNRVARVVARIAVQDRTSTFSTNVSAETLDQNGDPITELEVRPETVSVSVPLETRGKSVPVLTKTVGNPEQRYEVVDRQVNPASVVLDGPDEVLQDIFSVTTEQVSIEGATGPITDSVQIEGLPQDVRVIDPPDGAVAVVVEIIQRGIQQSLPPIPIVVSGIGPGLEASVEPNELTVTVIANDEALANLRAGDVIPRIDVTGLGAGTHPMAPTVALPRGVQWISTNPSQVTITLRQAGRATPVASGPHVFPEPAT